MALDLGITTYLFLLLNCVLLIVGFVRILVAIILLLTSILVFPPFINFGFMPIAADAFLLGMNEEAAFIFGVLAGCKNNIRLLLMYEFLLILLGTSKINALTEVSGTLSVVREDLNFSLREIMYETALNNRYQDRVDEIQRSFNCCGYNTPEFWLDFRDKKEPRDYNYTSSCCLEGTSKVCTKENKRELVCLHTVNQRFPNLLIRIHTYTLYVLIEVLLFVVGILLMWFIRRTLVNSLA